MPWVMPSATVGVFHDSVSMPHSDGYRAPSDNIDRQIA
jgi:hypothetical protein